MPSKKRIKELEEAIDYKTKFMNTYLDENKKLGAKHEVDDLEEEIDILKKELKREKFIDSKMLKANKNFKR